MHHRCGIDGLPNPQRGLKAHFVGGGDGSFIEAVT
jgi:hypothetical protein